MEFEIRDEVKKHYGEIAAKVSRDSGKASCCSRSSCSNKPEKISVGYTEDYTAPHCQDRKSKIVS